MWCLPTVLILSLLATPVFAGEPTFPGATWQAAREDSSLGWSAERLRVVEGRLEATKPTAVMIVHDGRVILSWGDVAHTVNVLSVTRSLVSALLSTASATPRAGLISIARWLPWAFTTTSPASPLRKETPPFVIC
jgi:hypothetical protein